LEDHQTLTSISNFDENRALVVAKSNEPTDLVTLANAAIGCQLERIKLCSEFQNLRRTVRLHPEAIIDALPAFCRLSSFHRYVVSCHRQDFMYMLAEEDIEGDTQESFAINLAELRNGSELTEDDRLAIERVSWNYSQLEAHLMDSPFRLNAFLLTTLET